MNELSIDIETYSSVDLKSCGLYRYVQSADFQLLLFAYSVDGGPVAIIDFAQGESLPAFLIKALRDPAVTKHAFNASFEWYCLKHFYYTPIEQWRCTMVHAMYCGYPNSLAGVAEAMGIPEDKRKMGVGRSLISTFCKPAVPTAKNGHRTRTLPHHEPDKWSLFKAYCMQDVKSEMEIKQRLLPFPLPVQEQELWQLDQRINETGVSVDESLIDSALQCNEAVSLELLQEAMTLSGIENPKSVKQLKSWLQQELGDDVTDLKKETVHELISEAEAGSVRRVLEIRQALSKASVKKYTKMKETTGTDGRIRGLLQFYGANRTGRWAGRLVQVQNLPKNELDTLYLARDLIKTRKVDMLSFLYSNVLDTLSQCIRTSFIPAPGHKFVVADFSAIEARVIAWLAGEQWRLDVFASHGKIYEASASKMFSVPLERIVKGNPEYELRSKGKVAELALGYQGGKGALINMGALKMGLEEADLPDIVQRWRLANKRIVDLWYRVERVAYEVIANGQPTGVNGLFFQRESDVESRQHFLTITLPSGRKLYYVRPFLRRSAGPVPDSIYYYGLNNKKWEPIPTYGGKLVENIVQAIARDCLAVSLKRLHEAGYTIVMHIHDEVVLEVQEDSDALEQVTTIMGQTIEWAPGLPLRADGFETLYYRKDG